MGLDMYAYRSKGFNPKSPVDFQEPEGSEEIMYWRKHPNLHGWMEQLYYKKGGSKKSFNTVPVLLTIDDLNDLAKDIIDRDLPETEGFFFGKSDGEEYNEDLEFCKKSIKSIKDGYTVWYTSWW